VCCAAAIIAVARADQNGRYRLYYPTLPWLDAKANVSTSTAKCSSSTTNSS
jgi:hypothetical protein